jgi:parallel beta-helix repeat protein
MIIERCSERYGTKASSGPATIANNVLSGSMVFGIAIAGAESFTLENNTLMGNTSFVGQIVII